MNSTMTRSVKSCAIGAIHVPKEQFMCEAQFMPEGPLATCNFLMLL